MKKFFKCKNKINLFKKTIIMLITINQFKYYLKQCIFIGFIIKWFTETREHYLKISKINLILRKVKLYYFK